MRERGGNVSHIKISPSSRAPHDGLGGFSLSEARTIVGQYFRPNPWIYWTDFLASWSLGVLCFALTSRPQLLASNSLWHSDVMTASTGWHWPATIALFVASSLLYYRCSLFIHELVHIRADEFKAFRFVWNMLCGIPFLIPSFVYYTHLDHHRRKHYGTHEDGEYVALSNMPARIILLYMAQVLVLPILAVVRWGLLTPMTWFSPRLRNWVLRHMSSMIMDPRYIRPLPTKKALRIIRMQEVLCFLFICGIVARMTMNYGLLFKEPLSPWILLQIYLTGVFIVMLNNLRTLGAHRWTSNGGEMNFIEQMLDSINYPHHPLTAGLWAPIGLRFHALHHIFPTMPYHAMAKAHRRLMAELPADSPYRQTEAKSLPAEIIALWRRAKASEQSSASEPAAITRRSA
ncbi:Fatty acid desaturase [Lacipirellula limnantheis]|uniref:Fatty acid desaturase n=1 Tax=Lacipirellula limnantheis TaxID=2528024 RepID=A0A517TRD9_9BACT|nr:Fatty acid desaturase [Lacipirellula limnantheis]